MSDWAEDKARKWMSEHYHPELDIPLPPRMVASLAALLRVVECQCGICHRPACREPHIMVSLAEVRRIVEEKLVHLPHPRCMHCEFLKRLEALK